MQAQGSDEYLSAVALDAVEVIAAYVGSLADEATGCSIIGDADYWNYGPNFKNSEEVQHG